MINIFPIDAFANDYSSHIARVFFLEKYGLHQVVPNWYNGNYTLLTYYTPLWYLFTWQLFRLVGNVQMAAYISLVIAYAIGFVLIYIFGDIIRISKIKRILFFLFFFVNPISIGWFLRLGKLPEMYGWLWFFLVAIIIFWYKDHELDWKFAFIIPVYVGLFYTHILAFIVASFLLVSIFILKINIRERLFIFISGIFILLLTSNFWLRFMNSLSQNVAGTYFSLQWLIDPGNLTDKIVSFIIPIIFWLIFYIYWKSRKKSRSDLLFFSFPLIISFLYITRIAVFIPGLNRPAPDTYHFFFIFLSLYMLFKIDWNSFSEKLGKYFIILLNVAVILGIIISLLLTPFFIPHTQNIKDSIELFNDVDGKLLILKSPPEVNRGAAYSYGAIYHNISTPAGWAAINISKDYLEKLSLPSTYLEEGNCDLIKLSLSNLMVENVLSYQKYCDTLEMCNFKLIKKKNDICLFRTPPL